MTFTLDWYQATVPGRIEGVGSMIDALVRRHSLDGNPLGYEDGAGHHGYKHRRQYLDREGDRHLAVQWGGHNGGVNIAASGPMAEPWAGFLRNPLFFAEHKVSRLDVAYDVSEEGAWDRMTKAALARAGTDIGTILVHSPTKPEEGGTLYIGGRTSPVRCRIYQKGWELHAKGKCKREDVDPNLIRTEFQVRPLTRDKARFSKVLPADVPGYARWARLLADDLFALNIAPIRRSERERGSLFQRINYMSTTYNRALMDLGYVIASSRNEPLSNAAMIRVATDFIAGELRRMHPEDTPFTPSWDVLSNLNDEWTTDD